MTIEMTERLLKIRDVEEMVGYGETKIRLWIDLGKFPKPIRPHGTGHLRWLLSEVQDWIADQVRQNREAA